VIAGTLNTKKKGGKFENIFGKKNREEKKEETHLNLHRNTIHAPPLFKN